MTATLTLTPALAQGEPAEAAELCPVPAPPPVPQPDTPLAMPEELRIDLFNTVWQVVDELYLFEDFNGADWAAVSTEFAVHVLETENAWEFYDLIDRMVGRLNDPLTTFVNPLVVEAIAQQEATYGGIGALLDRSFAERPGDVLRVVAVFPGSPAEAAGLRPRDRILAVGGDPCPRVEIIRGPEGTSVQLTVVAPGEEPRELTIVRANLQAVIRPEVNRLGANGEYAYLRLVSLSGQETVNGVVAAMELFSSGPPLGGLIVDVRGTGGGAPGVMVAILSYFLEGEVGAFYTRFDQTPLAITPSPFKRGFDSVPLVVLVDETSTVTAEQLAGLLQANGRALIVGQQTVGFTQTTRTIDFVGGSLLQMVVLGLRLPDGSAMERVGVTPDVAVEGDWAAFTESEDPFILAAIEALRAGLAPRGVTPPPAP